MFDPEYETILARWISDLRSEIPPIQLWWSDLHTRLESEATGLTRIHWPAGPVGHPRIIALYRQYYFEVRSLNIRVDQLAEHADDGPGPAPHMLWGVDDAQDDEEEGVASPVPPNVLLLSALRSYAPDVAEFMKKFDFKPIGEDPDLEVC
ncbi:hypothetical protein [Amaricoccus sp.]|uniref:hypothetical protein n=1 Tax=Amaricoccus sp. TaxID=1872485 RepID=UPI001B46FEBF|nr:hypothetical protein [Amaricoccus sp.]MBP7241250.1 hypothetical protein [Amaricoccus sp.]